MKPEDQPVAQPALGNPGRECNQTTWIMPIPGLLRTSAGQIAPACAAASVLLRPHTSFLRATVHEPDVSTRSSSVLHLPYAASDRHSSALPDKLSGIRAPSASSLPPGRSGTTW